MKGILKLLLAAIAVVCFMPQLGAQTIPLGWVDVYANRQMDAGVLIANGTVSFQPVSNSGTPISFRIGNGYGGIVGPDPWTAPVTNGVWSVIVPDVSYTAPANVCYAVTITDNVTGNVLTGPGLSCVQPVQGAGNGTPWAFTCASATSIQGGGCDFDGYTPNEAALAVTQTGPVGPAGPTGAAGPEGPEGPPSVNNSIAETSSFTVASNNLYDTKCTAACVATLPSSGSTGFLANIDNTQGTAAVTVASGGPTLYGPSGASGSFPLPVGYAVTIHWDGTHFVSSALPPLSSCNQGAVYGPEVCDMFQYADSTAINGLTAQSGNSTWSVAGAGTASTLGGFLVNSYGTGGNFYASLENTPTVGGTPQPVTTIGETFKLCPQSGGVTSFNSAGALIAEQQGAGLSTMIHITFGQSAWALSYYISGTQTDLLGYSYPVPLVADCSTSYTIGMVINATAGTVQVISPDGTLSPVITNSAITTINPEVGTWQISTGSGTANLEIGKVWMGGPGQDSKTSSAGGAAPMGAVNQLQAVVEPYELTLSGGVGWYTVATNGSDGGYILSGRLSFDATQSFSGYADMYFYGSTSGCNIYQISAFMPYGPISQFRCSWSGSTVQLDVYVPYSGTVNLWLAGTGSYTEVPGNNPAVGATALGSGSTTWSITNTPNPLGDLAVTGAGPYIPTMLHNYGTVNDLASLSDTSGGLQDSGVLLSAVVQTTQNFGKTLANCGTLTSTAAADDVFTCSWITPTSACSVMPTSSGASFTYATMWYTTITVYHPSTSGMTFAIACSAN